MTRWKKLLLGSALSVALIAGTAWTYRTELILLGVKRMSAAQFEIGPPREIEWSTGQGADGPRPPNIILIVADDLGINDVSYTNMGDAPPTVETPTSTPSPPVASCSAMGMRRTEPALPHAPRSCPGATPPDSASNSRPPLRP